MKSSLGSFGALLVVMLLIGIGISPVSARAASISGPYQVTVTRSRTTPEDVTITWKTAQATKSWMEYQESPASTGLTVYDARGEQTLDTMHRVGLRGISQDADHLFAIFVNGIRYDNHGTPYKILPNASYLSGDLTAALSTALESLPALSNGIALPVGTQLLYLDFDGRNLTLDLTEAALSQGKGAALEELQSRLNLAVDAFLEGQGLGEQRSIDYDILIEGLPAFAPQPRVSRPAAPTTIQYKQIVLSPGHGRYDDGYGNWLLQRSYYYGIVEDYINLDLVSQLNSLMSGTGGIPRPVRQLDKNAGNHYSGNPWWQMDAREYVKSIGAPDSVWNVGTGGVNQDIDARPFYGNWIGADAMVTIHNNGGDGGKYCGTETYYDNANGYQVASQALANRVHTKLIERLRAQWSSTWCDRGIKGSNYYGENRLFNGPAILVELAFMDNPSDNSALQNATFRSIAMTAIRDAVVEYFGASIDDATFVSDVTVPDDTVISPGEMFTKVWRMQNTGTSIWDSAYAWAFVSGNQMNGPASVAVSATSPGNQTDISVNMVAPNSLGTFQGNWSMRGAQGTLFGQTSWVKINVSGTPCPFTGDEIVLYENTGYNTPCKILGVGDYASPSAMGFPNDDAESIKVGANVQAILCPDDNYGGGCTSPLTSDTGDLSSTPLGNNQLSSLHVQPRACPESGGVILYWNANYDCDNSAGDPGYRQRQSFGWQNVIDGQFNDKASSVRIPAGWSARLYADWNRGEPSVCYAGDLADFGTLGNFPDSTIPINENVSSLEVFPNATCGPYESLYLPLVQR